MPFLMAGCFNKQPWLHVWHLAICLGSALIADILHAGFSGEVYCFCVHKPMLVWRVLLGVHLKNLSVNSSAYPCSFMFSVFVTDYFLPWMPLSVMGWTSPNPEKSWVLKHPTHQRCCVPADFLAFSLWLWIFLCWLQCCMVNKIQKLVCWFKRHKCKWKKVCLKKVTHGCVLEWDILMLSKQQQESEGWRQPLHFCEWSCKRIRVTFLLKVILMKFQDLPPYTFMLILSSLSTVLQHLTFLLPRLVSTSTPR